MSRDYNLNAINALVELGKRGPKVKAESNGLISFRNSTDASYIDVKAQNQIVNQALYMGDKDTDGSYRMLVEGGAFKIQLRVLGVWTDKQVINP